MAVHDYQAIDLNRLQAIIENHLSVFKIYTEVIKETTGYRDFLACCF